MSTQDWKSGDIDKLGPALLAAQTSMGAARKSSKNPHFNSKYADLNEVIDVVTEAYHAHGLAFFQRVEPTACGKGFLVHTIVMHAASGQWISSEIPGFPAMNEPQKIGAFITYLRRYGLAAISGLTQEDDDGNSASPPPRDHEGNGRSYGEPARSGNGHPNGYSGSNGNGYSSGNGNGMSRQAQGNGEKKEYPPPRTGKALWGWAREQSEKYDLDICRWLHGWGAKYQLGEKMYEWPDDAISDAQKAALGAIEKEVAKKAGRGEAAE